MTHSTYRFFVFTFCVKKMYFKKHFKADMFHTKCVVHADINVSISQLISLFENTLNTFQNLCCFLANALKKSQENRQWPQKQKHCRTYDI